LRQGTFLPATGQSSVPLLLHADPALGKTVSGAFPDFRTLHLFTPPSLSLLLRRSSCERHVDCQRSFPLSRMPEVPRQRHADSVNWSTFPKAPPVFSLFVPQPSFPVRCLPYVDVGLLSLSRRPCTALSFPLVFVSYLGSLWGAYADQQFSFLSLAIIIGLGVAHLFRLATPAKWLFGL